MTTYFLSIRAEEVVRVVKAEFEAAEGQPELYADAWEDYVIEEDYDRAAYGLQDGSELNLVSVEAELDIEPRVEQDYWVLSVLVRKNLGPQVIEDENALVGANLSLGEFENGFLAPDMGPATIRLDTQTPRAKRHFDQWWAELCARHPAKGGAIQTDGDRIAGSEGHSSEERTSQMSNETASAKSWAYRTREAVGVFGDADALEAAVEVLEESGFDRAGISVLGTGKEIGRRLGDLYERVSEVEEDPRAPRGAPSSRHSRAEGEAAAVAAPMYLGGFAGAAAVVAAGGELAAAIGATLLGAATGAGLGAILAYAVARRHAEGVEEQLSRGGLVLWVTVPDVEAENRAISVLTKAGARNVHVHEIEREWGPHDRPLAEVQVDPLLERDAPL